MDLNTLRFGGDYTPQSSSDKLIGLLGHGINTCSKIVTTNQWPPPIYSCKIHVVQHHLFRHVERKRTDSPNQMPSSRLKRAPASFKTKWCLETGLKTATFLKNMAWKFQEFGLNLLCKKKSLLTQIQLMFWNHLVMITYLGQSAKSPQKKSYTCNILKWKTIE